MSEKEDHRDSIVKNGHDHDDLGQHTGIVLFYVKGLPISIFSLILAGIASMGGFLFGYDTGQISDMLIMDDFLARFGDCNPETGVCHFSNVRSGLIVGLLSIGTLFGALAGAPLADILGRRNAMSIECTVLIVGIIIQVCSFHEWYQIMLGRFVAGLGVGGLSAAVPMYQAETAPAQIRGTLTATYQLFITLGILIANSISIATRSIDGAGSWRVVVALGIAFCVFLAVAIQFMPESPRWSARNGKVEDARAAIAKIRALPIHHPVVEIEMEEILDSIEVELGVSRERFIAGDPPTLKEVIAAQGGSGSTKKELIKQWSDLFKGFRRGSSRIGYRTLLGMALQALQQLTGMNYFMYYGATIFQSVGLSDSFVTQIILGSVNVVCTFLALYVFERYGRRKPLIVGGLWQSFWLFAYAIAGTIKDPRESEGVGNFMIVATCLFILGFASTWGPGIWILIGETFPTYSRARQGALATATNWFFNFLLAFFTPFIVSAIDFKYGYVFASGNFMGMLVVFFFLYESSGLTLENVDLMYRDPNCLPWKSGEWYPPGYSSRAEVEAEIRKQREERMAAALRGEKRDTAAPDSATTESNGGTPPTA